MLLVFGALLEIYSLATHYSFLGSLQSSCLVNPSNSGPIRFDLPGPCFAQAVVFLDPGAAWNPFSTTLPDACSWDFGYCGGCQPCSCANATICPFMCSSACPSPAFLAAKFHDTTAPDPSLRQTLVTRDTALCSNITAIPRVRVSLQWYVLDPLNQPVAHGAQPVQDINNIVLTTQYHLITLENSQVGNVNCNYYAPGSTPLGIRFLYAGVAQQNGGDSSDVAIDNLKQFVPAAIWLIAIKEGLKAVLLMTTLCWPYMRFACRVVWVI